MKFGLPKCRELFFVPSNSVGQDVILCYFCAKIDVFV